MHFIFNKKALLCAALLTTAAGAAVAQSVTQYVDPYIGSGGHGHVFVGASVLFGAVQVGPTIIFLNAPPIINCILIRLPGSR